MNNKTKPSNLFASDITKISRSERATLNVAAAVADQLNGGDTICFFGDVGAGKTVFTRGLCRALGFSGYVNSPSYILVNEYQAEKFRIYHYDLYRLHSLDELTEIGYYHFCGQPENITLIEWADMLEIELPESRIEVHIKTIDAKTREITITDKRKSEI